MAHLTEMTIRLERTVTQERATVPVSAKENGITNEENSLEGIDASQDYYIIKPLQGTSFAINGETSDTVEVLKARIQDKDGSPSDRQRLIFAGKQMQDGMTLADHGVQRGSTIHMVMRA